MWAVATAGLDGLSHILNIFEGSFPCVSLFWEFCIVSGERELFKYLCFSVSAGSSDAGSLESSHLPE